MTAGPVVMPATVVVLAKAAHAAKSRLGVSRHEASDIAVRLAAGTVAAALAATQVARVLVVTGEGPIAEDARAAGAEVVHETTPLGMNRAAALGVAAARRTAPDAPVVVVVADLPHLGGGDLDAVVQEHALVGTPLFVADHHGTGTTCLVLAAGQRSGFGFGLHSARMHRRLGYLPSLAAPAGLRVDLDTADDLEQLALTAR